MTGRAEERTVIESFIASFLAGEEQDHTSPYISGSPGTGKTALVNDVLRVSRGNLEANGVRATLINCMALKSVDAVWHSLAEAIDEERKAASQTGDVRATFEVLRGAIDLALAEVTSDNPISAPSPVVTPANILAALKAQPSTSGTVLSGCGLSRPASEMVEKVRGLGLHQRLALLALVLARQRADAGLTLSNPVAAGSPYKTSRSPVKRTQSAAAASASHDNIDAAHLHALYSAILARGDSAVFTPVSRSDFADLLGLLETSGRKGFTRSSSFTTGSGKGNTQEVSFVADVRLEEVLCGLGVAVSGAEVEEPPVDAREEEVRAIWERERARIAREVKVSARATATTDVFEGAMEV
ncbi:hypothetical protein FOMPIDRAFT_1056291 [Fomitopsis schrenkii]|uniref:Uncharacterized protein n=1 Tax=Fomitopsis schrenkii TaxID=2126942 RepID=S8DHQ4_FOMSC|nr:hypothetical protein FOMPIDRAFT_1056291 [Fomitopsis schrenkii]